MAMTIIQLVKYLPMKNCGDCGKATCLAFASHVIKKKESLALCPYLERDVYEQLRQEIERQHAENVNTAPDRYQTVKESVSAKIKDDDFSKLAHFLGGRYCMREGKQILALDYLGRKYEVSKEKVMAADGQEQDVWDHILLYNYIASHCGKSPTGKWIGIDSLPGSIPKKPELRETCEKKIAQAFRGNLEGLRRAVLSIGGKVLKEEANADLMAVIHPLPKTPFLLLFWRADDEEGFEERVKVLFDETIGCFLDIESMVFLAEKMAIRLIEIRDRDKA